MERNGPFREDGYMKKINHFPKSGQKENLKKKAGCINISVINAGYK